MDAPRLLVTGGRGFLGAHVVAAARARGCTVLAAGRRADGADTLALDVTQAGAVADAFARWRPTHVIHCAAYGVDYREQDAGQALAVNVHGALNVLAGAAACGVQRLVHVGSCFEYGDHAGAIDEDAPLRPTAIYGSTKAAATLLVRERAAALGVPIVIARPFGLWGPGEGAHRLVPQIVAACRRRVPLELTPCDVVRDYSYVADPAAELVALALAASCETGTIVNLGSGQGVVLRDFVAAIARLLDGEDLLRFGARPHRPTEMHSLVADVRRARALLGERVATPLAAGLRRMCEAAECAA